MSIDRDSIQPSKAREFWNNLESSHRPTSNTAEQKTHAIAIKGEGLLNPTNSQTATETITQAKPKQIPNMAALKKMGANTPSTQCFIQQMKEMGKARTNHLQVLNRASGNTPSSGNLIHEMNRAYDKQEKREQFGALCDPPFQSTSEVKSTAPTFHNPVNQPDKTPKPVGIQNTGLEPNDYNEIGRLLTRLPPESTKMVQVRDHSLLISKDGNGNTCCLKVTLNPPLGRGNLGEVYRVTDPYSGAEGIMKMARVDKGEVAVADLKNEVKLLRDIHSQGQLKGIQSPPGRMFTFTDDSNTERHAYVTKIYNGGKMFDNKNFKPRGMSLPNKLEGFHQLLSGLDSLHQLGVKHGDIKPNNALLHIRPDGSCELELSDFGGCVKYEDLTAEIVRQDPYAGGVDQAYLSSEDKKLLEGLSSNVADDDVLMDTFRELSEKRDVYAAGRALWQFVTGDEAGSISLGEPVRYTKEDRTIDATLKNQLDSYEPVLNDLKTLIADMTKLNPYERITTQVAKERMEGILQQIKSTRRNS